MHGFDITAWLEDRSGAAHLAAETARWVRDAQTVTGILTAPLGAPRPA